MSAPCSSRSSRTATSKRAPRFETLLAGHDARGPAEATLVLAAAAALCGLRADGSLMPGSTFPEGSVSVQAIADELGLYRGAASRGVEHCVRTGALVRMPDGTVRPAPEVHATRWAQDRQRVRLDRTDRERGLRGPVLLLLGLIRGQLDPRGQLRLGVTLLAERTGLQPRVVERHLAALRRIGAIHTWLVPGKWQLVVAMGPCRETSEEERAREAVADGCRETSVPDVANRRSRCREASEEIRSPEYRINLRRRARARALLNQRPEQQSRNQSPGTGQSRPRRHRLPSPRSRASSNSGCSESLPAASRSCSRRTRTTCPQSPT